MRFATVDDKFEIGQTIFTGWEYPDMIDHKGARENKWNACNIATITGVREDGVIFFDTQDGPVFIDMHKCGAKPNENGVYSLSHMFFWCDLRVLILEPSEERELRVQHARWTERDAYRSSHYWPTEKYMQAYKAALAALKELGG